MRIAADSLERGLVAGLLILLIWLPLPLGSSRDWTVGVFVTWVGLRGLAWAELGVVAVLEKNADQLRNVMVSYDLLI